MQKRQKRREGGTTPDDVIVKKKTRFGLDAISNFDDGTTNAEFDEFDDDDGFAAKTTEARQKETPLKSAVSFTRRKRKGGCFIQPTEAVKVGDEKKADEEERRKRGARFALRRAHRMMKPTRRKRRKRRNINRCTWIWGKNRSRTRRVRYAG